MVLLSNKPWFTRLLDHRAVAVDSSAWNVGYGNNLIANLFHRTRLGLLSLQWWVESNQLSISPRYISKRPWSWLYGALHITSLYSDSRHDVCSMRILEILDNNETMSKRLQPHPKSYIDTLSYHLSYNHIEDPSQILVKQAGVKSYLVGNESTPNKMLQLDADE